jgi:hypothetical protein
MVGGETAMFLFFPEAPEGCTVWIHLVFSVGIDRMIHTVWYIIRVCELKMSNPGC